MCPGSAFPLAHSVSCGVLRCGGVSRGPSPAATSRDTLPPHSSRCGLEIRPGGIVDFHRLALSLQDVGQNPIELRTAHAPHVTTPSPKILAIRPPNPKPSATVGLPIAHHPSRVHPFGLHHAMHMVSANMQRQQPSFPVPADFHNGIAHGSTVGGKLQPIRRFPHLAFRETSQPGHRSHPALMTVSTTARISRQVRAIGAERQKIDHRKPS